jgi:chorismate mutase
MIISDIEGLRAKIDTIDDRIIALLDERAAIVKNVGEIKKGIQKPGNSFIRSGREADLIRSIYKKFKGNAFPANAAVQIWRVIISASLTLESELAVAVCDPEPESRAYWLTREYFGGFLPVSRRKNAKDVIDGILSGNVQVGVLPLAGGPWWADLPEEIKVFACVPFVLQHAEHKVGALAVARIEPEATEEDVVLLKLTADKAMAQGDIAGIFAKHKIKARVLGSRENACLVELTGLARESARVIPAVMRETGVVLAAVGSYAAPLKI